MMTNLERAKSYISPKSTTEIKLFAGFAKSSGRSVVLFYESDALINLLESGSNAFKFRDDGVRWAGPMVNRLDRHNEFARLTIDCPWNKFQVGSNGFMSDAQEQAVLAALTDTTSSWYVKPGKEQLLTWLRNLPWTWTGHDHRRGTHDLTATIDLPNGEILKITIEVKGVGGRVYYS